MGRWKALAIVAALAAVALPAIGQGDYQPPGQQMSGLTGDAALLYEDVQILRTVRTLALTGEQLEELRQINSGVLRERSELAALRENTWDDAEEDIEAVLSAWMSGENPSTRAQRAADNAVNRINAAREDYQQARWNATEALYDALSDEQRDSVESPGAAEVRMARAARMGGVESPGQFILIELDAIRDLMPDEFEMLGVAEAQRIARALVGPDASNLGAMSDAVLDVMLEVYAWTPDRYRNQRAELPAQIEVRLGLQAAGAPPPVSWTDLMRVATSTRTPAAAGSLAVDDEAGDEGGEDAGDAAEDGAGDGAGDGGEAQ